MFAVIFVQIDLHYYHDYVVEHHIIWFYPIMHREDIERTNRYI